MSCFMFSTHMWESASVTTVIRRQLHVSNWRLHLSLKVSLCESVTSISRSGDSTQRPSSHTTTLHPHITRSDVTEATGKSLDCRCSLCQRIKPNQRLYSGGIFRVQGLKDFYWAYQRLDQCFMNDCVSKEEQTFFSTLSSVSGRLMSKQMRTASESG